jgi:hypothetical protein
MDPARIDPKKQKPSNNYLKYSSLGLQLFGAIGLSAWAGHALDVHFQFTFPGFLISLVMITFAGMMVQVYRSMNKD